MLEQEKLVAPTEVGLALRTKWYFLPGYSNTSKSTVKSDKVYYVNYDVSQGRSGRVEIRLSLGCEHTYARGWDLPGGLGVRAFLSVPCTLVGVAVAPLSTELALLELSC